MATDVLIGLGVAWLLTGVVTGFVMRRMGHDVSVWFVLGSILGPVVIPLAIEKVRTGHEVETDLQGSPKVARGDLDILIGVDHSADAIDGARSAIGMLGTLATSVTIATVLDLESKDSYSGKEAQEQARHLLDSVVSELPYPNVRTEILFGRPHIALSEYARHHGMELIVVGPRGHGATEALFGSVTKNIIARSEVPILVGPRARS